MGGGYLRWVLLAAAVLGAAAMVGDLVLISARYWRFTLPVLLLSGGLAYWSLGPSKDAPDPATQLDDDGRPLWAPIPWWQEIGLRLLSTVVILALGIVALGVALFLLVLAWENLWISVPFCAVALALVVMAIWPDKSKAKAPKPPRRFLSPGDIVSGGGRRSKDIVS